MEIQILVFTMSEIHEVSGFIGWLSVGWLKLVHAYVDINRNKCVLKYTCDQTWYDQSETTKWADCRFLESS